MNTRRRGHDRMAVVRIGMAIDTDRFSGFGGDSTSMECETCVPMVGGPLNVEGPRPVPSLHEQAEWDVRALGSTIGGQIARLVTGVSRDVCGMPEIFLRSLREAVFDCIEDELFDLEMSDRPRIHVDDLADDAEDDDDSGDEDGECLSGAREG